MVGFTSIELTVVQSSEEEELWAGEVLLVVLIQIAKYRTSLPASFLYISQPYNLYLSQLLAEPSH